MICSVVFLDVEVYGGTSLCIQIATAVATVCFYTSQGTHLWASIRAFLLTREEVYAWDPTLEEKVMGLKGIINMQPWCEIQGRVYKMPQAFVD